MIDIKKGKKLDFTIGDVIEIYSGPVGILWEMLMGEEIHVGGRKETEKLADMAKLGKDIEVLDICSALGGPARFLADRFGCKVTGIDATEKMVNEAIKRTDKAGLSHLISYIHGNALDLPFKAESFDVIWGQDAWCYVTDKDRLIKEAYRVLKPGGVIAFTDWMQTGNMSEQEWKELNGFMAFPYMETLDGYSRLLENTGFVGISTEDLSVDFTRHCQLYQKMLREELKASIIKTYGNELFDAADEGLNKWVKAANDAKVGRGRIIGTKSNTQ